jgi:hypothetical protein
VGDRLQFPLGERLLGEDRLGVTEQRLARVGQAGPASGALEQRHAGPALERRHLLGDCRLCVSQRLGRGRQRTQPGHLTKHPEVTKLKHKLSLERFRTDLDLTL